MSLSLHDLRLSYGFVRAVRGVSFTVESGHTLALVGPNGAGKTSTLHMAVGLLAPDSGQVRLMGRTFGPATPSRARMDIAYLPDRAPLQERLTALEYARYVGGLWGFKGTDAQARVLPYFDALGVLGDRDRLVMSRSFGTKQKIALASFLALDTPVLVLDEPTTGLDPMAVRQLRRLLADRNSRGLCTLLSTHVLAEAEAMADSVVVLAAGRVRASGTVEHLLAQAEEMDPSVSDSSGAASRLERAVFALGPWAADEDRVA